MSLKVVLMTRSGRPSGAQMAWRLLESGFTPVVIVEKRERMAGKNNSLFSFIKKWGFAFVFKKTLETFKIKVHFYLRKFLKKKFSSQTYLSIEEFALDQSIKLLWVNDHNGPETVEILRELQPDIGVLTNTRRIHKEILDIPKHGFLNMHLSLLPKYAGLDSIFWALYHGEKEVGATIHFAAEKIDQGDIVLQKKILVSESDDENSLYEKALWMGTFSMLQALRQLEAGTLQRRPQSGEASYFSWPTSKERKDFKKQQKKINLKSRASGTPRVLHVITRMIRGGAQINTLATAIGLRKKGYHVTLVTGPSWGNEDEILSEALQDEGLEVLIMRELVREINPLKDLLALQKLYSLMVRNRYDIVHTHTSKAGLIGRQAAYMAKVPTIIHTPHGHVFHSYFSALKENLFIFLERWAAKKTHRLVALTQKCCDEHLELGVGKPEQWTVIPSGVSEQSITDYSYKRKEILEGLGISPERKIIGFIGRLAPIKGCRFLIWALPKIYWKKHNFHCLFVGDGERKDFLKKAVVGINLQARVTFAGYRKDISEFLSVFDVLVVPSLNEGMGRVIVEAGFLKKPVVATNVGGIIDLIEQEKTGLLVPPADPDLLANAILHLFENPNKAAQLGENLHKKVLAGFTEAHMVEKIHTLYSELLGDKKIAGAELNIQAPEEAFSGR